MEGRHSGGCSQTPASGALDGRATWGSVVVCSLDSVGNQAERDQKYAGEGSQQENEGRKDERL